MTGYKGTLLRCVKTIQTITDFKPKVALILGSGLGGFAETIHPVATISYHDIPDFPTSTVAGHAGRFVFGYIGTLPIVCMQGRVHFYEGYPMEDVVLPVRIMKLLGADTLLLTNAAGGVNYSFTPGDLMVITDHISSLVPSPLLGKNIDSLGTRFPDMSQVYDLDLQKLLHEVGKTQGLTLREGVYLQFTGPAYETPAEIRMARVLGADAVGMSTACEAVAANHMGMKICGISCITNYASGMSDAPLDHTEVQQTADRVAESFQALLTAFLTQLGKNNE